MAKTLIACLAGLPFLACSGPAPVTATLQRQVDSLRQQVDSLRQQVARGYAPGFGEFMAGIQVHHVKLWFAGTAGNWPLARYELGEISEALDDIAKHETARRESALVGMLRPALDSVGAAVAKADTTRFRHSYRLLTSTCNACHRDTDHGFNVIKIPDRQPFSDQTFAP